MMQSPAANPMLMAKLLQMRQGMQPPQSTPAGNPGQAFTMLNNNQAMPMGMSGQPSSGMTMGQPNPAIMQQLLARRRAMMSGGQPGGTMTGTMGQPPTMDNGMSVMAGMPR